MSETLRKTKMIGVHKMRCLQFSGRVVVVLGLLAGLSRFPVALAAEDQEDYSEVCSIGPTDPMLVSSAYADYRLVKGPYYELTETASIDDTHRAEIHTQSCSDSVRTTFQFRVRDADTKAFGIDDWARYARTQIVKLHMKKPMTATDPEFMNFLSALPAHAPDIHSLKVCMDGTIADENGCSWRTGGGREAAFEKKDGWMVVTVTEDSSH